MTRPEVATLHRALEDQGYYVTPIGDAVKVHERGEEGPILHLAPLVEAVLAAQWRDIASVPEGEHVLLWFPNGERGIGGIEAATVFWEPPDAPRAHQQLGLWTHGGPNSGSDWEPVEQPTHWQPLPPPPKDPPT